MNIFHVTHRGKSSRVTHLRTMTGLAYFNCDHLLPDCWLGVVCRLVGLYGRQFIQLIPHQLHVLQHRAKNAIGGKFAIAGSFCCVFFFFWGPLSGSSQFSKPFFRQLRGTFGIVPFRKCLHRYTTPWTHDLEMFQGILNRFTFYWPSSKHTLNKFIVGGCGICTLAIVGG